jgi:predicted TIM-barrel fold metal-dependent hydrolase
MLLPRQIDAPGLKSAIRLAVKNNIVLHVHAGADEVAALFGAEPRLRILWAHAGMNEDAPTVGRLMDRHKNLWSDLSFRASDIMARDKLEAAWLALFRRYADRFMIGTDTWVASRWDDYQALIEAHRRWLALLPDDLARAIAYRNAVRLFGDGGRAELKD